MKQNFRRDKMKKEEMRKKKQEEKRNKRLHKKDVSAPDAGVLANPGEILDPSLSAGQMSL